MLSEINQIQGSLKSLSEKEYNKLKKSIEENGFDVPFFLWIPIKNETANIEGNQVKIVKGKKYSLDGCQRHRVLTKEGFSETKFPYVEIKCEDFKTAKTAILRISSQYGRISQDSFDSFAFDLDDTWIKNTVNFDALSFADCFPPSDNMEIDEEKMAETKNTCPKCGFRW